MAEDRVTSARWTRYTRQPCPGCVTAGYADRRGHAAHRLCRSRPGDGGTVLHCRSLSPEAAPAAWRVLGDGALGTQAYFIPHAAPRPAPAPRAPRRAKPAPAAATDGVLDLAYSHIRRRCAETDLANSDAVHAFFAERGAAWDPLAYSIAPTRAEERAILAGLPGEGHALPGVARNPHTRYLVRARRDPEVAYLEWVLGPAGEVLQMRWRFIGAADAKSKAHGTPQLHHPLRWQDCASTLYVTEGVRKANESQRLTGHACLGVPGVSFGERILAEAITAARLAQPARIVLAPDLADLVDPDRSDDVRRAVFGQWRHLAQRLAAVGGAEVTWAVWDPARGKGLDDALVAGAALEHVELDDYLALWRWRDGEPAHWRAARVDPFPHSTRPPVRTIDDSTTTVVAILADWRPGTQSLALSGFPGSGKTTAAAMDMLRRMRCGLLACAVLALPSRALVREKVGRLADLALAEGIHVPILPALGASDAEGEPFRCADFGARQRRASLGHWSCRGCPTTLRAVCTSEPGCYRFDDGQVRDRLRGASQSRPVFLVTTLAKLPDLARTLPATAVLVLDDIGSADFGLVRRVEHTVDDVHTAADAADRTRAAADIGTACAALDRDPSTIPDVLVADLVADVLDAIHRGDDAALAAAVDASPLRDAIAAGRVHPPRAGWSWEATRDEHGLLPHLTRLALDVAEAQLAGHRSTILRDGDRVTVAVPVPGLITRARAGRMVWLSVGRMPATLAEGLGARREHLDADPAQATVLAVSDRVFGVRDEVHVGHVFEAIRDRCRTSGLTYRGHSFGAAGAVLRKAGRAGLADDEGVLHYGAGHASTDLLADRDVLVVSRFALPPAEVAAQARVLAGMLALEPGDYHATAQEWRGWGGHPVHRECHVHLDPLARDVAGFFEQQQQLNAVGRCRPLSATTPRLIIVLAGIPFGGVRVHDVLALRDLTLDLVLDLDVPGGSVADRAAEQERRAAEDQHRADVVGEFWRDYVRSRGAPPSIRTIARGTGLSKYAVEQVLAVLAFEALRTESPTPSPGESVLAFLPAQTSAPRKEKGTEGHLAIGAVRTKAPTLIAPPLPYLAKRTGLSPRAAGRWMRDILAAEAQGLPPSVPRQERGRENRAAVLCAMEEFAAECARAASLATAADARRRRDESGRLPFDRNHGEVGAVASRSPLPRGQVPITTEAQEGRPHETV
ncbi:MAG: DUF3854 domain-containing protein [Planctomycetes bacterium]|nr:DUF3854 domain-containing protein [Planctomycetota bacterium]